MQDLADEDVQIKASQGRTFGEQRLDKEAKTEGVQSV